MAAINDVEEFVMLEVLRSRKNDENLLSDEFKKLVGWTYFTKVVSEGIESVPNSFNLILS